MGPIEVEIEYEYISQNLLRKREKPFTNKEEENVIIWIYDNYKMTTDIKNVNLEIKFENQMEPLSIRAYPEKFLLKNTPIDTISWNTKELAANSYKNFALNIPIFNYSSKGIVIITFI